MELDITIHKGSPHKPVVIFIHGLSMDRNFWIDPLETKVLGKNIPMKVFAAEQPGPVQPGQHPIGRAITIGDIPYKINNLWAALRDQGFNLVCWSQRRSAGPMNSAVEELEKIIKLARRTFPEKNIALVCHSRGGLIARKFMEQCPRQIKALITIATPHKGSSLSLVSKHLSPLSAFTKGVLPDNMHGTVSDVVKKLADFIDSAALKELMPGSDFFKNLKDAPVKGVKYLSFGGSKTELVTLYRWKKRDNIMYSQPLIVIPDSLIKIIPAALVPDEVRAGKGDFMVTLKSAALPWADNHHNLNANHISITWDKRVIKKTIELIKEM